MLDDHSRGSFIASAGVNDDGQGLIIRNYDNQIEPVDGDSIVLAASPELGDQLKLDDLQHGSKHGSAA